MIIKNSMVVTEQGMAFADIAVEDGKIAAIRAQIMPNSSEEVIDASGLIALPGFIDGHTHMDMDNGVTVTADDFASGTRAALLGGTTTIIDFATQDKDGTLNDALDTWHQKADGRCHCDYAFHMAITDWNEQTKAELQDMFERGVSSFKLYFAYDALRVSDRDTYEILTCMKRLGGLTGVHCENGDLVNAGVAREKELGHFSPIAHPASRPALVEAEAVERLLTIARLADCTVNIVHLSSEEGLEAVRRARKRGQRVLVETCPQYLLLTDERYKEPLFSGAKYVCSPPLRSPHDQAALRCALLNGEIDTVSTDHCSYRLAQKAIGKEDFSRIPNGLPGVEHRPELIYSEFVDSGLMTITEFSKLLSTNVARQFGLYPQKGTLRIGSDADIVLWDTHLECVIRAAAQAQRTDYTPYEGTKLHGAPKTVLLGGRIAVMDGLQILEKAGRYIARKPVHV